MHQLGLPNGRLAACAQVISILLYHALPQGSFAAKELGALGSLQTDLGITLGKALPLTFATTAAGVVCTGP